MKPFYDLVNLRSTVIIAEKRLGELRRVSQRSNAPAGLTQKIEEAEARVDGGGVESDPTTRELGEIVKEVERICQPAIQGDRHAGRGGV